MVCLKQLSLTTAVALSIAETAVAVPINNHGSNAALGRRQAYPEGLGSSLPVRSEDIEERDSGDDLEVRTIWGNGKLNKHVFNNVFKFLNVGNAIAANAMPKRDLDERDFEEDLDERDFEEDLEERYFEDELEERDFEDDLEERYFEDDLEERYFEDDLEERDLEERDFEEMVRRAVEHLEGRELDERALAGALKALKSVGGVAAKAGKAIWSGAKTAGGGVKAVGKAAGKGVAPSNANFGERLGAGLDAAYTITTTGGTIMSAKNAADAAKKAQQAQPKGKRAMEELERRAFEDLIRELYF